MMGGLRSKPEPQHWERAFIEGGIAAAAFYAVVTVAFEAHVPVALAALVTLVVSAVALVIACTTVAGAVAWWAAACGVTALGWVPFAMLTAPWHKWALLAYALAAIILIPLYPVAAGHERHLRELARLRAEEAARLAGQRRWPDLLEKIGYKGVRYVREEATRSGHTVVLQLPSSAKVRFKTLVENTDRLEVAARVRHGSLRFERPLGAQAHEVLLHVAEKDILGETVSYPAETTPLSICKPVPVGLHEDGETCSVLLREIATLIVGLRGSGKSNLTDVLIAQLARCYDAIIFMIDLKGGRTARPWLKPWIEGGAHRPIIDWVATTREEAEIMLRAVRRAIDARAHSGAGGEKITPSRALPAVMLIIEEIAVIFGQSGYGPSTSLGGTTNNHLAGLGMQIVQLGRSEAIDPIAITQRGTVTMTGGGDFKSQFGLRIGLGVASEADARLIIPDDVTVATTLARLQHPGSGIVSYRNTRPAPVKFWRIEHEQKAALAQACGIIRPAPDAALAAALGEDYANRWTHQRAGHLLGTARPLVPAAVGGEGLHEEFAQIIEAGFGETVADDTANPQRRRMLELLDDTGVRGATPKVLRDQLEAEFGENAAARQTLQRWLSEEASRGRVVSASYGRWKSARAA